MDRKLIEAAKKGDVQKLHNLIKDNPFLLRVVEFLGGGDTDTPLHIACIAGNLDFVKLVLSLRPEFAVEINQHGFTPLHIASANGDLEIVKEILKLGSHLCLVKGKEKRIPLHCAVSKGRIQVIGELVSACMDSITDVTARGESCFHLAVKNNQFEAFKVLIQLADIHQKDDVLNIKDKIGNTVLHYAADRKQYEVVDLLLDEKFGYKGKLEVNSLNECGLTPLDVLISNGGDCEIEEMLKTAGATRIEEMQSTQVTSHHPSSQQEPRRDPYKKLQDYFKYDKSKDTPRGVRNTLLVIAVLIATATYQAVLSPPGGVWQDDFWPVDNSSAKQPPRHTAGQAVMGTNSSKSYGLFLLFNSMGFFMSLHMMYFLTHGLPLQFELGVALTALTATYDTCMIAITPNGMISLLFMIASIVMPLIMPILSMVVRNYIKGRRCAVPSTSTSTSASA